MNSEVEAVSKLKQGDTAGLETLVALHQQGAVRLAALITRDPQIAADVVSASFLAAYDGIGRFDSTRPFRPWFYRIVVNRALKVIGDQLRFSSLDEFERTRFSAEEALAPRDMSISDPAEVALIAEMEQEVRRALGFLTIKQRTVVVLRYYAGMDEAEIANCLGIPNGTVKSRASAAMRHLRRLLGHIRIR